jgi:hypothetical protein
LCWCTIELTLALGSSTLKSYGIGTSIYPKNISVSVDPWDISFIYHPLLQTVLKPNWQFKEPLDFSGVEDEAKAAGVDIVSLQGQQITFVHNSLGFRGRELTAADLDKDLVFVYGGSTTYDIGVTQGETWVERLQAELNNKYTVLNLGIPAHSTAEHLIQTAFYQNIVRKKPVCSLYYVGWNDIVSAHLEHLDSAYADYHLLITPVRRPDISFAKYSPFVSLINAVARNRFDTVPRHPKVLGRTPVEGSDEHLEGIFSEHIKTIAAINEARGIKTVFIGQILNRHWPQGPDSFAPLVKKGDFVPLVERLKSVLKSTIASTSAKYIDPGVMNFGDGDFVDLGHFTSGGALKFATLISKEVDNNCRSDIKTHLNKR